MADLTKDQVIDFLSNMNIMDLMALKTELEDKWGVDASAAAPAMMMAAAPGAGPAAAEEKSEFDVVLESFGGNKIPVIKVVKAILGVGLAEAKGLVEGAPVTIKEAVATADAEDMKAKIEEAGGTVELK